MISESEFKKWTMSWSELEGNNALFPSFLYDKKLQLGVTLNGTAVTALLSTMGATTIKVRFGLREDDKGVFRFELLLFGIDAYGQRLTPYYNPEQVELKEPSAPIPQDGNMPDELAVQWKANWAALDQLDKLSTALFETNYGFLQGYNYPVKEFMDTLLPVGSTPDITIWFAVHQYYGVPTSPDVAHDKPVSTFGLVFNAASGSTSTLAGASEESGYFDLTAPCPRTC